MKWNLSVTAAALLGASSLFIGVSAPRPARASGGSPDTVTEGSLIRIDSKTDRVEPCPLKHTDVKADISGFIARVNVTQEFLNPTQEKIEAVYKFPLPPNSAVDAMTMLVGDRRISGKIKKREEARQIYEAARSRGQLASLLDQERPNIFTQSVANIGPGQTVKIEISYVETLKYEDAAFEFSFPMVVGPRYNPRGLPNADAVVPRRTPEGTRAGHDLSIQVSLDAGMALHAIDSPTHVVDIEKPDIRHATVKLRDQATIPNKDFILRYSPVADKIQDAVLAHADQRGGYFMLVLQPPARVAEQEVTPKEIVFVLDTSGSMMGFPIEKAKEAMKLAMDGLHARDTFNLITFSGDEHILFPQPVPATPENVREAQQFLMSRQGRGGTEMMKAIRAALDPSDESDHIRIACFMTDGEVGNDFEIINQVKTHTNARVFSFGIGSSVNRFLLDNMARFGRGEVEYVGLNDDGSAAARRFHERVRTPVLTDISLDFGGLPVSEVYPKRIPDLFSAKPVVVVGRYTGAVSGAVRLRGKIAGRPFERTIALRLPPVEASHNVLPTMWARAKVDDLMGADLIGMQTGNPKQEVRNEITRLGLDYALMTQYTSFVAVEEKQVTEGGQPRRIEVPVEMPEGVSYEGVYGERAVPVGARAMVMFAPMRKSSMPVAAPGGVVGGVLSTVDEAEPRRTERPRTVQPSPAIYHNPAVAWKISPALANAGPGELLVQIYLKDTSQATLDKLKDAGVTLVGKPSGSIVFGKIDGTKLAQLAALQEVRFIGPKS